MIYFMQHDAGWPVKIGFTDQISTRHKALQKHYGLPLTILAMTEGDLDTEAEIHQRFAHLRLDGRKSRGRQIEQFRPAAELMSFIGMPLLVSPNPETVEAMIPTKQSGAFIRVSQSVADDARVLAGMHGVTLVEYISGILEPILKQELVEALKRLIDSSGE